MLDAHLIWYSFYSEAFMLKVQVNYVNFFQENDFFYFRVVVRVVFDGGQRDDKWWLEC